MDNSKPDGAESDRTPLGGIAIIQASDGIALAAAVNYLLKRYKRSGEVFITNGRFCQTMERVR